VIPEIDTWRAANLMLTRHGKKVLDESTTSCVRQVQQIDHVERVLVGFQVNSSIPLFDRK
jgi:hypothetical protein